MHAHTQIHAHTHTHAQTEQQCRLPRSNVILTLSSNTHLRFHQLLLDLSPNCKFCLHMMLHFDITTAVKKQTKKGEEKKEKLKLRYCWSDIYICTQLHSAAQYWVGAVFLCLL